MFASVADRLAIALNVPVSKILDAAGQRQRGQPFVLPARANRLSQTERNIVRQVIDAMLGQYAEERPEETPTPLRSVAARRAPSEGKRRRREQDRDAES